MEVQEVYITCNEFQQLLENLDGEIKEQKEKLRQCNALQEDILHEIEFSKGGTRKAATIFAKLRKCRIERRKAKDLIYFLEAINRQVGGKQGLIRELGNMQRMIDIGKQRQYTPRAVS